MTESDEECIKVVSLGKMEDGPLNVSCSFKPIQHFAKFEEYTFVGSGERNQLHLWHKSIDTFLKVLMNVQQSPRSDCAK